MKKLLLLSLLVLASVALGDSAANPAIQWAYVQPLTTLSIPTVSEYQSKWGVAVQVYSDSPRIRSYIVTVRYTAGGASQEQTQAVIRDQTTTWVPLIFWMGQPVQVLSVRAEGMKAVESNEVN